MKTNLATFDGTIDAEALTAFLLNHGIHAGVQDERRLQRFWFWVAPRAGLHVLVPNEEYEQAHQLAERNAGFLMRRSVHCTACHSTRVHYPAVTRKNILPAIVAKVLGALGVMKPEYYCEDCHHTWRPLK